MTRKAETIQMAHTAAVKKGEVVFVDGFAMVALNDGAKNELVAYGVEGAFDFKKASGGNLVVGGKAYMTAGKDVTHDKASNTYLGRVVSVSGNVIEVKINVGA